MPDLHGSHAGGDEGAVRPLRSDGGREWQPGGDPPNGPERGGRRRGSASPLAVITPGAGSMLSAEFTDELRAARRRVAVLEEANQAIQESIDRITRLSSFSEGLDRSVSISDVADLLFEEVRGILPLENLLLALVDSTGQEFRPVKVDPADISALAAQELAAQVASGMFGWAVGLRRPTTVPATHLGTHLILVPLATARRTVGMLMVGTPLAAGAVEQQHLTLASVVARQAAECIDNLWLAEDIRRQHEAGRLAAEAAAARRLADLGLLVETAGAVSATLERDTALRILVDATCRHLGVTTVAIALLEGSGRFGMAHGAGLPGGACADPACGAEHACPLGLVVRQRAPLAITHATNDARVADCPLVCGNRVASLVGVPLVARDHVLGVLSIMTDTAREFSVEEIALLTGLAAQAASAIENARLFADVQGRMEQQQQTLARLVQSAHLASVGLLAGGVAHDINNPLCIISNHLQLLRLRKSEIPLEVEEALGSIETSVRRIAGSIEALLEYARVQPGERQPTDLNEAMRRILVLLQYHPLCRRLSVVTDLETGLPMVNLDRAGWEQIMLELVTNAREAMADGGRVRIATRRVAPAGEPAASPWIEVVVEDNGPGIPSEEVARVFDPFFTTRAAKRGMGIGLKICRDIVHEHDGRMRVESDGQAGTRVVILLQAFRPEHHGGEASSVRRDQ